MPKRDPETQRAYNRLYYQKHRDELRLKHRLYYQKHRDEQLAYKKLYRLANPEKVRASQQRYYQKHAAKILTKSKQYNRQHRKERQAYGERYRQKHPLQQKLRNAIKNARRHERSGRASRLDLQHLLHDQGYRCAYCNQPLNHDFHIDHVVPISRGGTNDIVNLVCACRPCNLSKGNQLLSEWAGRAP